MEEGVMSEELRIKIKNIKKTLHSKLCTLNSQGFSLVEMIVVVAIAGMIILILGNIPSSLGLIGGSKQEATVNQIINKKIEDLRSQGYDNLANGTTTISDTRLSSLPGSSSQVIIEDCPAGTCNNGELIKKVTIKVSWKASNKDKSIEVKTLISQGGLQ